MRYIEKKQYEDVFMDKMRFAEALKQSALSETSAGGIGTLAEKSVHNVLKYYFEPFDSNHEIPMGGFVADIVGENGIIEIQTASFQRLRDKLAAFLEVSRVTVVYPMANERWLLWIDKDSGELISRRKCRSAANPYGCFPELYKIKPHLRNENFTLCIVLLDIEELKYRDGRGKDKKIKATKVDRIPIDIEDEIYFREPADYRFFIPNGLAEEFTTKDFSAAAGISSELGSVALNILTHMGITERSGKTGRTPLYRVVPDGC